MLQILVCQATAHIQMSVTMDFVYCVVVFEVVIMVLMTVFFKCVTSDRPF